MKHFARKTSFVSRLSMTALAAALWLGSSSLHAALTVEVGSITLTAPEISPTSTVQIQVSNSGSSIDIGALDFFIEVEAGGPIIQSVDLLTGTLFESNNAGQDAFEGNSDHLQGWGALSGNTPPPPQLPNGQSLMATVTFDSTGVTPGDYTLKLGGTGFGDTEYNDPLANAYEMSIINGTLTVVPEPRHTALLGGLALLAVAALRRRLAG